MAGRETQEARETVSDAIADLMGDMDVWPNLPDGLRDGFTDAMTALDVLAVRLAEAEEALRGVDAICEEYAEGRHDAIVALGKIGVLRLYGAASRKEPS